MPLRALIANEGNLFPFKLQIFVICFNCRMTAGIVRDILKTVNLPSGSVQPNLHPFN